MLLGALFASSGLDGDVTTVLSLLIVGLVFLSTIVLVWLNEHRPSAWVRAVSVTVAVLQVAGVCVWLLEYDHIEFKLRELVYRVKAPGILREKGIYEGTTPVDDLEGFEVGSEYEVILIWEDGVQYERLVVAMDQERRTVKFVKDPSRLSHPNCFCCDRHLPTPSARTYVPLSIESDPPGAFVMIRLDARKDDGATNAAPN